MNEQAPPYHINVLRRYFEDKKRINPQFSLRAFAKYLKLDSAALSCILKNKRSLPRKHASFVCNRLKLDLDEKNAFINDIENLTRTKSRKCLVNPINEFTFIEDKEKNHNLISQWEYYAILHLMDANDFLPDTKWIANRFNLDIHRVESVVGDLKDLGLIEISHNEGWKKKVRALTTSNDISSRALRQSHKETLSMAIDKIEDVPVELRSYTSSTVCIDTKNLGEAKKIIKDFQRKLGALLESGQKKEVYQLAVQLFPLTQIDEESS